MKSVSRAVLAVLLLSSLALAGCSGPPGLERDEPHRDVPGGGDGGGGGGDSGGGGDGTPTPTPTPTPDRAALLLDFDLEGCSGLETLLELDVASAQAVLPEGYTVFAAPATVGAGDVATAQYVWTHCDGLRTAASFVNDTVFGFVALRVEAPEDAAEADEHWYRYRMLAQEDVLAQLWRAAGYEVVVGEYANEASVGGLPGVPSPEVRDVRLGQYGSQGAASTASSGPSVSTAHYSETDGGRVEWVGAYEASAARGFTGDFRVAGDDPLSSTQTTGGVAQRYLDAAAWSGNDLWLRP